jgi:hypothetical protein
MIAMPEQAFSHPAIFASIAIAPTIGATAQEKAR